MSRELTKEPPVSPAPVKVVAADAPETKKRIKPEDFFYILEYLLWPNWAQKYHEYLKWAKGNEDRIDEAKKKFRIALTAAFGFWVLWWVALANLSVWSIHPWIIAGFFIGAWIGFSFSFFLALPWWLLVWLVSGDAIHSSWYTLWFMFLTWACACTMLNIFCVGIGKWPGTFAIPDWKEYLTKNKRLHWTEFPEACAWIEPPLFKKAWHWLRHREKLLPTKRETTFALGSNGKDWITYGWYGGKVEHIKTGRFVYGDPQYDPENALRYLTICAAPATFFCLDGDKFGGVGFRHLRGIPSCLIYGEDKETGNEDITKAVRWIHREMGRRREGGNYPRLVLVCDQKMMEVFAPSYWVESAKTYFYHWPKIRDEMIDILRHGSRFNIFVIGIVEPSDRVTSMQSDWLPYVLAVSLYYYQPVTNEKGTIWVSPHPNHYTDVFSIMDGDDRVIGKLPYIPEPEMIALLKYHAGHDDNDSRQLRFRARTEIPEMILGKKEPDANLPLWKRIGVERPLQIKPGDIPPEVGATEAFYQLHHAQKFDAANGNGANGKQQKEFELEKK